MEENNTPIDSDNSDSPAGSDDPGRAPIGRDSGSKPISESVASRVTFLTGVIVGLGVSLMFVLGFLTGTVVGTDPNSGSAEPIPSASKTADPTKTDVPTPTPSNSVDVPDIPVPAGSAGYGQPLVFGNPEAETTVAVVEDFTCPFCAAFNLETKDAVNEAIAGNNIRLEYYPVAFFGDGAYRMAEAAVCAADQGSFLPYSEVLYEIQKPDRSAPSDKELIGIAEQVSLGDIAAFTACLESGEFLPYIDSLNERAEQARVPGTPTVFVNKQIVDPSVLNPQLFISILEGEPFENVAPQPLG